MKSLLLVLGLLTAVPGFAQRLHQADNQRQAEVAKRGADVMPYYVKVTVGDTGHGMRPDVLTRACEPFYTTKEVGKGTGLGLSQVYGFIAQSGGELVLESEVGRGTRAQIYLPAIAAAVVAERDAQPAAAPQAEKVLIVEDEPDLREAAAELFRSMDYAVVTAGNARDALTILEREPDVGVLFTDVMMPNGMNGIELAQHTRATRPKMKIIIASGYSPAALQADAGALDSFAFMSKPYRFSEFGQAFARGLAKRIGYDTDCSFAKSGAANQERRWRKMM